MKKKLGSFALALVLSFCLFPAMAFAQENDTFTITYKTNAGVEMGTVEYEVGDVDNALPEARDMANLFVKFLNRVRQKGSVAVAAPMWYNDADFSEVATFPDGEAGKNYVLYCRFTTGLSLSSVFNGASDKSYSTVMGGTSGLQPYLSVTYSNGNARNDQYEKTLPVFEKEVNGNWVEVDESYYTDCSGSEWPTTIFFSNVSDSGLYRLKYLRYTATDNEGKVLYYDMAYDSPDVTYSVNITPVELSIVGVQAIDRNCDGSNVVALTGGNLTGVLFDDDVSFDLGVGLLEDANPGADKPVAVNAKLTGSKADNYILIQPTDVQATISCKPVHVAGNESTCTRPGNIEYWHCEGCGRYYSDEELTQEITQADTVIPAAGHHAVMIPAKEATHLKEGNHAYWYCEDCGTCFSDEDSTQEIPFVDTVIPKLTEHTVDGTGWHSDETNHWNTCECGEKLNEAAHTFEWVIDKEATATEKGSKHEECTVCGYAKAAVEIPTTGTPLDTDTSSPQTGDDSNIALWIAVLLAAGVALTSTAVYSRKRKYSK